MTAARQRQLTRVWRVACADMSTACALGWRSGEGALAADFMMLLLLFSRSVVSDYLRPRGLQHARSSVFHHLPQFAQTHVH